MLVNVTFAFVCVLLIGPASGHVATEWDTGDVCYRFVATSLDWGARGSKDTMLGMPVMRAVWVQAGETMAWDGRLLWGLA